MVGKKIRSPRLLEAQLHAWIAEVERMRSRVERQLADGRAEYCEHLGGPRDDIEAQLKRWGKELGPGCPRSGRQGVMRELRAAIETELRDWGPQLAALKGKAGDAGRGATHRRGPEGSS